MTSTCSLQSVEGAVANTKMAKDTQSGTVSPVSATSTTEASLSTTSTTESSISLSRRSSRQTKSTITYINGQPVLKSNNYAVKGTVYKFEEDGDDVNPVVKKRALDITTNGNKKYKVSASIPRITPPHEIQRKAHNNGIRSSKEVKQNLRQSFLKDHVEIFKPFLEDYVYENLVHFQPAKENDVVAAEVSQPKLITGGKLRDYQIDGLKFMVGHYHQNLGTILGDEMGLGKRPPLTTLFCFYY
jgi:SNF2 family DNA or RNA helicase